MFKWSGHIQAMSPVSHFTTRLNLLDRKYLPVAFYTALSLLIMAPLLGHGYLLLLDITDLLEGPVQWETRFFGLLPGLNIRLPYYLLAGFMNIIFPEWVTQKIFWFFAFLIAGLGAYKLCPTKSQAGKYFTGMLYMVNPFVYARVLAGQIGLVLSYALIPLALYYFLALLENKSKKSFILTVVLTTLIAVFQIQLVFLVLFTFVVTFIVKVIQKRRDRRYLVATTKKVTWLSVAFLLVNSYWLIPSLAVGPTVLGQIGGGDIFAFAPKPSYPFGVMFNSASMYGFWRGGYIYTKDILPFWWVLFVFILFLAVYGFLSRLRDNRHRWIVLSFGVVAVVSFLLAVGAASELTRPTFEWLWEHIFFFRGFRDSQKFVALLCLSYAYLGGVGVNELVNELRQQRKKLVRAGMIALVAVALLTPPAYSFTMFGFHGQLGTTDYPKEWYEINDYLNKDESDFNVLFLPWHQYMDYSWLPNRDKRLANPGRHFFDKPVISGDNIEMPGIYSQSTNPISKYVEFLLKKENDVNNLGELLAPLNVKYVILIHEADYETYDFLYEQEDLEVEMEKHGITLFSNEHPTARAYAVDSVVYINSLEEYLELSKKQDVMKHLYIIGSGLSDNGSAEIEKLNFVEKSPVTYQAEGTSYRYTIFTVPQYVNTNEWEYDGKKPLKHLGFMPVFASSPDGGEILYTRFYHIYLPSYIASALALLLVLCYSFYGKLRGRFVK